MIKLSLPDKLNRFSVENLVRGLISEKSDEIITQAVFSDNQNKPYGRKVLFQDGQLELLLTGWNPGYSCWPHSHGDKAEGIVFVLKGQGIFHTLPFHGQTGKVKTLSGGESIFVPKEEVHSMTNEGPGQLVCLHAYWPPVGEMRIYDPTLKNSWLVSEGGAWRPDSAHILETRKESFMEAKPLRIYMEERGLTEHPFLNRVLGHIENHQLFQHPFFQAFCGGQLSIDQVRLWAKQRLFSSRWFPRNLAAFVSRIEDIDIALAYTKQIYEEYGNLDPEKVHSRQLARLSLALGVGREILNAEIMLPGTKNFVDTYTRLTREGNVTKCMGMYAFGSEPVIVMEMILCIQGLTTIPWLERDDVIFFSDHALHDYRHTCELIDVILPHIATEAEQEQAWQGMVDIIEARKGLYDGIAKAIGL